MVEQALTLAYLPLISWVRRWVPEPIASDIAAGSMASMVRDAMIGHRTTYGPYRLLYSLAEFHMRWWGQANCVDIPFGVWRTIPVPVPELVCELARSYALIHEGVELGALSIPEQDLLLSVLFRGRYNDQGHWIMPLGDPDVPVATALADRVTQALDSHVCNDYDGCGEFIDLWRHEDRASERWRTGFMPHSRESAHGY
jgi:hypothetical protein